MSEAVSFSLGSRAPLVKTETGEVKRMQPGKSNTTVGKNIGTQGVQELFFVN